jgi:anti-sigma regulatory factor (Ser/Thr protein kinase)
VVGPTAVSTDLTAEFVNVAAARRFVRANVAEFGMPPAVATDLELIASELVTNAIEHGAGHTVRITLDCRDGTAVLTVESAGPSPGVGPVREWEVADPTSIAGRGLGIVRRIADEVRVDQTSDRLAVTVRRHLGH